MIAVEREWYWPDIQTGLLVSASVMETLSSNRQSFWGSERGGQLFVDPTFPSGLLLALATLPHKSDRAGRNWINLDHKRCREEIERENAKGLRLVGYWHTHPETAPNLSQQDISSFVSQSQCERSQLPNPIAVIVGRPEHPNGIRAWRFEGSLPVIAKTLRR